MDPTEPVRSGPEDLGTRFGYGVTGQLALQNLAQLVAGQG